MLTEIESENAKEFLGTVPDTFYRRLLFVCSAGRCRSATGAHLFARKGFNTRAVGTAIPYAICPLTSSTIAWADLIFCMEREHLNEVKKLYPGAEHKVTVLKIPDEYHYRDPALEKIIEQKVKNTLLKKFGDLDPVHELEINDKHADYNQMESLWESD